MNKGKKLGSAFTICLMTAVMINCVSPINAKANETLSTTPCRTTLVGTETIGNEGNGTSTNTSVKTHCDIAQVLDTEESKEERDSWNNIYSGINFEVTSKTVVGCEWLKKTQTVEDLVNKIKKAIEDGAITINGYDTTSINDENIKQIAQNILAGKNGKIEYVATTTIVKDDIGIPEFSTAPRKTEVSTSTVFEEPKDSYLDIYKGQYIQLDLSADMSIDDLVTTIKTILKGKAVAINGYDTASINDGNIKEIAQKILNGENGQYKHAATTTTIQDATAKPLNQAGSTSTSKTFDGNSILGVLGALTLAGSSLKFVSKKKNK